MPQNGGASKQRCHYSQPNPMFNKSGTSVPISTKTKKEARFRGPPDQMPLLSDGGGVDDGPGGPGDNGAARFAD